MSPTKTNITNMDIENARLGYQVASDLSEFYGGAIWSMFNAMLLANSIIVAGVTYVLTSAGHLSLLKILLPVIGVLLCITWFLLVKRAHEYSSYYLLSAREIEEYFLKDSVKTLSRGGAFGSGEVIVFQLDGKQITRRMSIWALIIRNEVVSYLIILIFIAVYVGIFFQI
jgi:hypothetical protein